MQAEYFGIELPERLRSRVVRRGSTWVKRGRLNSEVAPAPPSRNSGSRLNHDFETFLRFGPSNSESFCTVFQRNAVDVNHFRPAQSPHRTRPVLGPAPGRLPRGFGSS